MTAEQMYMFFKGACAVFAILGVIIGTLIALLHKDMKKSIDKNTDAVMPLILDMEKVKLVQVQHTETLREHGTDIHELKKNVQHHTFLLTNTK